MVEATDAEKPAKEKYFDPTRIPALINDIASEEVLGFKFLKPEYELRLESQRKDEAYRCHQFFIYVKLQGSYKETYAKCKIRCDYFLVNEKGKNEHSEVIKKLEKVGIPSYTWEEKEEHGWFVSSDNSNFSDFNETTCGKLNDFLLSEHEECACAVPTQIEIKSGDLTFHTGIGEGITLDYNDKRENSDSNLVALTTATSIILTKFLENGISYD